MSESQKNSRPRREKANTHPADVLLNAKQKRRSPTEKAAADKAKTDRDEESAAKAQKSRHNAVAQIAQLEDRIQREDKAYPIIADYHDMDTSHSDTEGTAPKENEQGPSGNQIEGGMISKSDPENPESPQVVIGDTDDSCGGDNDYNSSDPDDSDDSEADDDQSVEYDSGLEENPHTKERGKKGDEGSVQSENSDSELEENPRSKRKGKGKGKGKGVKGRIDKRKKKKAQSPGLRHEVTKLRKTSSAAASSRKRKPEGDKETRDSEEETQHAKPPQKKTKKNIETASGLRSDWRKLVDKSKNKSGPQSKSKRAMADINISMIDPTLTPTQPRRCPVAFDASDDDHVTLASEVSHSRPSSRASAWSRARSTSEGTDSVLDPWTPGAFDDDEVPSSLHAARTAKKMGSSHANSSRAKPFNQSESMPSGRTTATIGPIIKKRDVNIAAGLMRGPVIKSEGGEVAKPYRQLKVVDIPITGEHENIQWDLIVRGVIDWVGTLPDTFGTNEHPDLLDTVQGLWDECLPEREEDVHNNPVIKKVIVDRLNDWRSTIGKKAIVYFNEYIKKDEVLRRDPHEVALLVGSLLPYPAGKPDVFPLIYSHPKASKGSWLAPLLIQVLAVHLRRVAKAPNTFGFPTGALALSTAALERALTLYRTGVDIREDRRDPILLQAHAFDSNPWGGIASQYAQSTRKIPKHKWEQIIQAASPHISDRSGSTTNAETRMPSAGTHGRSRIIVSDDEAAGEQGGNSEED